jgi:hypothetical protein
MFASHRHAFARVAQLAFVALIAIVANAARAAPWYSDVGGVVIDTNSIAPSTRISGSSVWVLYTPTLSVDCSPPPKCYASTQRINVHFSCSPRYSLQMERVSMDLNGNVVNREVREPAARYDTAVDFVGNAVLDYYCPALDEEHPESPPRKRR